MGDFFTDVVNTSNEVVDIATGRKNPTDSSGLNALLDIVVQHTTFGLAGIDSLGGLKKGGVTRGLDEALGEITGRNLRRKALMDANAAADEAKKARDLQLSNERQREYNLDVQRSQAAGAVRRNAEISASNLKYNSLGSDNPGKDFLGLS